MIKLEDITEKQYFMQNFFLWLFDDDNIVNKTINMHSEVDFTLAHTYSDSKIYYPTQFKDFFETKAMKRLGKISQLGFVVNTHPNAYHSRLEHSKGVFNRKVEELFYNYQNPKWKKYIENNNLKLYLIAELFKVAGHDIGHPPFSHAFEYQILKTPGAHEEIGTRIMLENKQIQNVLLSISPKLPEILSKLYKKNFLNFKNHDESSYDVDRLDYLSRDSLYLGFNTNLSTQNYENICVETDKNKIPKCNSDGSIKVCSTGSSYIDAYDFSALSEIEDFLILRENRYADVYMSQNTQMSEGCISRFLDAFMTYPSCVGIDLKNFIINMKTKNIKDIDINEYIDWDEVRLYSELLTIAEHHENSNIKDLSTMLIPNMNSFLNLLYSHLTIYKRTKSFSDAEKLLLEKVKILIKSNSTLANNLRNKDYVSNNTLIFPENMRFPYNESLLTDKIITIKSYKSNEPIYIKDLTGRIFELSKHPNKSLDWNNRQYKFHLRYSHIPYLRYKGLSENEIDSLKKYSINNVPFMPGNNVNMTPLKIENSIEDYFLDL